MVFFCSAGRRFTLATSSEVAYAWAIVKQSEFQRRVLFGGALAAFGLAFSERAAAWEEMGLSEGIRVFRREVAGSPLVAFKGTGLVSAPVSRVCWVLADNEHRTQWVDRLKRSVVLERKADFDYVVYQHFELPPLMSDRDYVYRARGRRNATTGTITLKMESVTHPKAPPTVGVRAHLIGSSYTLVPRGEKTLLTVEIHTDPKGSLPAWLVNRIQRSWPENTISALRRQVAKPFVKDLVIT